MEQWMEAEACDGFVIAATHTPGAYEDVVRLVVRSFSVAVSFESGTRGRRFATPWDSPGQRAELGG